MIPVVAELMGQLGVAFYARRALICLVHASEKAHLLTYLIINEQKSKTPCPLSFKTRKDIFIRSRAGDTSFFILNKH